MSKRSTAETEEPPTQSKRNKTTTSTSTSTSMPTDMQSSTKPTLQRILVIGLAGHAPGHTPSSSQPRGKFRQSLKTVAIKAKEAGLDVDMMQIKPSAFPAGLQDIKEKLKLQPDGLVIGNGIRGTAGYTVFFEDLVNASREITPNTRLAFNTSPDDILECCLRNFVKDRS